MGRNWIYGLTAITTFSLLTSCQKSSVDAAVVATPKTLYVASGLCYSGSGLTTYTKLTASRAVTKWATDSAVFKEVFTDLNVATNISVNTTPQALIDGGDHILMLTENDVTMGDRKIFKIFKNDPGTYLTYATDPTAFTDTATHIIRSMALDADGSMHFSKSLFSERLNSLGVRITKAGANPWVNPLASTSDCFNGAGSLISQVGLLAPFTDMRQGKLVYLHSGASAVSNRIGIVQRTGLTSATAGDCAGSSPVGGVSTVAHSLAPGLSGAITFLGTGASLTSMVLIPTPAPALTTAKLIVSYSGSAAALNNSANFNFGIVMWDITETSDIAATITNPKIMWNDESVVFAPSAMAYDASTSSLYVAVGGTPSTLAQDSLGYGYNIEKFTFDMATPKLTRVAINNKPFIIGNAFTQCISSMIVAD